jgi:hypothetical protein
MGRDRDGTPDEEQLDDILADSFPASDPPPWTLGVMHAPARVAPPYQVERRSS